MLRIFWIHCGINLQRRRRVHRLPLEQLSILELRTSIMRTIRLDLKWRVGGTDDPRPIRRVDVEAAKYCPSSMETQAVTWAWFLDDGLHIVCVIDDILIQLWHLPTNKPLFIVNAGGTLVRASKFVNQKYFVLVASTSVESTDDEDAAYVHYLLRCRRVIDKVTEQIDSSKCGNMNGGQTDLIKMTRRL
jgi:hypothetical protein